MMLPSKILLVLTCTTPFFILGCSSGAGTAATPPPPNIPSATLASAARVAEVEQFEAIEGEANIHIGINDRGIILSTAMLSAGSEDVDEVVDIGPFTAEQFHNFSASPGQYRFSIRHDDYYGDYLLSEFDLILEAGAMVYIDCSASLGVVRYIRDDGPVLRRFSDACPAGVQIENGVGACEVPYDDDVTNLGAIVNNGAYLGACLLEEDPGVFRNHDLVTSSVSKITGAGYEYRLAQELDSIEGWQNYINRVPNGEFIVQAQHRIAELQAQADIDARTAEIEATLARDSRLPLTAQKDKYLIALTGHLQNEAFAESLIYFDLLDRLNVEVSPSITYFWGEALLRTGNPEAAIDKLYDYVASEGAEGTYYRDALLLVNEAESM